MGKVHDKAHEIVKKELAKILREFDDNDNLYSEAVEDILDVIFRQNVQWFVENKELVFGQSPDV